MFNQIYFQEALLIRPIDRNRYISRHASALIGDKKPANVNTSIFRQVRSWVCGTLLGVILIGCGDQAIAQPTSALDTPTTNIEQSDESIDMSKYGCIGTIQTLALNDPNTGEIIARMPDHSPIRIDGDVSAQQDKTLDNAAKTKEGNPDADYTWKKITYIDPKTGEIFEGAAASNWIDPRNPVNLGCEHKPGQQVHEGYGEYYERK